MDVMKIVVYISLHVFSIFLPPPFNWCDKIYYTVNSFTGNNLFTEETMIKLYGCYYHIQLKGVLSSHKSVTGILPNNPTMLPAFSVFMNFHP